MGVFSNKEQKSTTYTWTFECDNCCEESELEVPFGMKVEDFGKITKCDNCGCILWPEGRIPNHNEDEEDDEE